jgi:SAM-dependent methyltransferase
MSMTTLACATLEDVEARNEAFAREHDIDDYYANSSVFIRWIEGRRLNAICRMTAARPGQELLEVGCGGGHVLRLFPEAQSTGVDVSGRMLDTTPNPSTESSAQKSSNMLTTLGDYLRKCAECFDPAGGSWSRFPTTMSFMLSKICFVQQVSRACLRLGVWLGVGINTIYMYGVSGK